ncbi:aromatic aminotransferase [Colletotrichum plurivorum]|uniref:Aromatic aminotransferase n=1 Tax=Colletotrichum plurivorum TaxID=2175906 RepID=A0A8H6K5I6_9PEZI|nr:aromatic aminotransferase [Colletotrichum plurivorum]
MVSITGLPTEILLHIVSLLCPHCIIESQNLGKCSCDEPLASNYHNPLLLPPGERYTPWESLRRDLSRLSQTCRVLRDMAQPVLFHCPMPRYGRFLSLARTLVRRPDLARSVRELHLGTWVILYDEDVTAEDQEMFNATLDDFEMPEHLLKEDGTWPRDWLQAGVGFVPRTYEGAGAQFFDNRERVVNALCAILVPNVEHLHLRPLERPEFPFNAPGSLPRLTDLTMSAAEGMVMGHCRGIMDAAPALLRFKGSKINGVSLGAGKPPLNHANLRSVDLENSLLSDPSVKLIMGGFPRLESFGYEGSFQVNSGLENVAEPRGREVNPKEFGQALLLRKDTLRDVDFWRPEHEVQDREWVESEEVMQSLKVMEVLEELALDRDAIYDPDMHPEEWDEMMMDDDDDPDDIGGHGGDREKTLVVNFLPRSIRYFKMYDRGGMLFHDVARLAADAPTDFPNLKKVRFWGYSETQRMALRGVFRKAGIKFYHGGYL